MRVVDWRQPTDQVLATVAPYRFPRNIGHSVEKLFSCQMINRSRSIYPVLLDGVHHLLWHRIIDRIVLLNAPDETFFDQHIGFCHHRNDAYHTAPYQLSEIADLNPATSAFSMKRAKISACSSLMDMRSATNVRNSRAFS